MKPKIKLLLTIVIVLLAGCTQPAESPVYPTQVDIPTYLPTQTNQTTPPTDQIAVVEATTLPPLSPNNTKEVLSLFVKENGGCKIPCLIGLSPGVNYKSVESFGSYFIDNAIQSSDKIDSVDIVGHLDENNGGAIIVFWENRIRVQIGVGAARLTMDEEQIDHVTLSASVYEHSEDNNGRETVTLLRQHPYFNSLLGDFSLHNILTQHGEPTEIWIFPFPEDLGYSYESSAYSFIFVLVYIDIGFAIEYIGLVKDEGENLVGCPNVDYFSISTWNPRWKKSINDIAQYFSGTDSLSKSNVTFFKPLEAATSLTVRDFYENFKENNVENPCIQTPRRLWE